jgi:hypothetical protein
MQALGAIPTLTDFDARLAVHVMPGEKREALRARIVAEVSDLTLGDDTTLEQADRFLAIYPLTIATDLMWAGSGGEVLDMEEVRATMLDRKIAEALKEAELVNVAFDEIMKRISGASAAPSEPPAPEPTPEPIDADILGPLEALKAKIDAVRATGSVDPSGVDDIEPLTTADLVNMVADNPPGSAAELEEAVRALKGEARRRFSEQLNVELAELKNSRGLAGEDLKREQQVEYLLGLFARVGEI